MSAARTLFWIALLMVGTGSLDRDALEDSAGLHLLAGLAFSYLCFMWYRKDSDTRGFARTRWLSMGMVAFTPGAIPFYLLRSRRDGERGQALIAYAASLAAVAMAIWVGVAVHIAMA